MLRFPSVALVSALTLLSAPLARAAPEPDIERQAAMAQRFEPFDGAGGPGWTTAFPTPFFRAVASGKPEAVPLRLRPGAYMIVVLCNCQSMEVTLVGPGETTIAPLKSGDQAAMYSLDVKDGADYLAGVDMGACSEAQCDFAVKVYRKES